MHVSLFERALLGLTTPSFQTLIHDHQISNQIDASGSSSIIHCNWRLFILCGMNSLPDHVKRLVGMVVVATSVAVIVPTAVVPTALTVMVVVVATAVMVVVVATAVVVAKAVTVVYGGDGGNGGGDGGDGSGGDDGVGCGSDGANGGRPKGSSIYDVHKKIRFLTPPLPVH